MRGFLTTPIERAVSAFGGIDHIESESRQGVSIVTIRLELGYDTTKALAEVTARLQQVRSELPSEAEPPTIDVQRADRPYASFYISFTSEQRSLSQVTDYLVRNVQPQLGTIAGVQRVTVEAGRPLAMRVWIDPDKLAALGLAPGDVYAAIQRNNYLAAVGQTKGNLVQVNLLADTDLRSVEEFEQLIVRDRDGAIVRMSDVARVELGAEEADFMAKYNQKPAVYLGVWPLVGANEIDVQAALVAEMDLLRAGLPPDLEMELAYDGTVFMRDALHEISITLIETICIVGLIVFLFLGSVRTALVPLVAMPVSLIGAAVVMAAFGFSLNLLTILAIVLSVGLVVDDAIVVVENVERHVRMGKGKLAAAAEAARELVGPIIAMTITLAAVYTPIGFQGGLTGALFLEFAITLAAAVLVSGFVAITLSPIMSAWFVSPHDKQPRLTNLVNSVFDRIRDVYTRLLDGARSSRRRCWSPSRRIRSTRGRTASSRRSRTRATSACSSTSRPTRPSRRSTRRRARSSPRSTSSTKRASCGHWSRTGAASAAWSPRTGSSASARRRSCIRSCSAWSRWCRACASSRGSTRRCRRRASTTSSSCCRAASRSRACCRRPWPSSAPAGRAASSSTSTPTSRWTGQRRASRSTANASPTSAWTSRPSAASSARCSAAATSTASTGSTAATR